jgi:LacI family transcriptional regulator
MIVNGRRLQLMHRSVTLEDVSIAAGVSKSTASRALCNEPNVKSETRERVQAIATRLGYVPNEAARALAARRAVVIGASRAAG